jgi:hypothetical protein
VEAGFLKKLSAFGATALFTTTPKKRGSRDNILS